MLGVVWVPRDGLFPLPVEEKASSRFSGNARDGLFPLPAEEKLISGTPMRPKSGPVGVIWVPCNCLFLLPVEEKAIARLSGNARNGLFPLPVEEKALSGFPQEAQERPFTDDERQL